MKVLFQSKGECLLEKEILLKNIEKIKEQINTYKTDHKTVDMIAVTKYVDSDTIRTLYELGLRHFGENRVNELLRKQEELADFNEDITWHFIGQLQRRPVRKIINNISFLHSLDRMSLIEEVDKRAEKIVQAFLQVNISGEEQKAGFKPADVLATIKGLKHFSNIKVVGLMMMAPYDAEDNALHGYFNELKQLQVQIQSLGLDYAPCQRLSMGMTADFPIAIQEGATDIRIGRALYNL